MKKPFYPDTFKKSIRAAIEKYLHKLWLNAYKIDTEYMREDDGNTFAKMTTETAYIQGTLAIFPCFLEAWKEKKDRRAYVEEIISHEMAHCFIADLASVSSRRWITEAEHRAAMENLTERIARLVR